MDSGTCFGLPVDKRFEIEPRERARAFVPHLCPEISCRLRQCAKNPNRLTSWVLLRDGNGKRRWARKEGIPAVVKLGLKSPGIHVSSEDPRQVQKSSGGWAAGGF